MVMNIMLVLFNLIPAFPMDGGRILRATLAFFLPFEQATLFAARTGQFLAVVGGIIAFFINPLLAVTSLFVFMGAEQELRFIRFRVSFAGIPVCKTMLTEFRVVTPLNSLGQIAELLQSGSQRDFPVMDRGQLVGHLSHDEILAGLRSQGPDTRVADIMRSQYFMVGSFDLLDVIIPRMQSTGCSSLPVVHENRLVGLLTLDNIAEYQQLQAALQVKR
jgi:predicted transcriptional regulator